MRTLIFYFLASHLVSFMCSILEAVLLSCTNSYIAVLKKKKHHSGDILSSLKSSINSPLAAILTLNTGAHTFGAAGVGAQVVELYGNQWLAAASIILTLTMLYLTEMVPKTIGAVYWKSLAPISAYLIKVLIFITYPFVVSFEWIAHLISRGKRLEKITTEEIKVVLEEGTLAGVIEEVEQDMLESIFRLGSRRVGMLMTNRMDIKWLNVHDASEEIRRKIEAYPYNRFPLCENELDHIVGVITSKDLLIQLLSNEPLDLKKLAHPPMYVPENMRILQLLDHFKKNPIHFALVTDEYGGIQGLITLNDVLESIIETSSDLLTAKAQIIKRKDDSWLVDGLLPIDEFKELFEIDRLPSEKKEFYRTVAGFCMMQLGSIPHVGDIFTWGKLSFKIVKMDGRRIEKVLISKLP